MITVINKTNDSMVIPLNCSIPTLEAQKTGFKIGKKEIENVKVASERTLTLQPFEKRERLPDAVLETSLVKNLESSGRIMIKRCKEIVNVKLTKTAQAKK